MPLRFDNAFLRELPGDPDQGPGTREVAGAAWSRVLPTPVAAPRLVAASADMIAALGLDPDYVASPEFAATFAGNRLSPGMDPWAANYGGHQFGHWAGQLGDGRAISLGEVVAADGRRHELQLKGAGPTPYSRRADGRAVLRSSIREFLCSEAMHHLGVPTTRALSLVVTGDSVLRDMFYDGHAAPEPGAIVCRVAPSFLRFGSFELPASRGDVALLRQLAEFCIWRDFPELLGGRAGASLAQLRTEDAFAEPVLAAWFHEICVRTAVVVGHWMRVGFVHGVLNTDNMSILGLTIDYGPYGWIDDYDPDWTPNTTDAQGRRYRFGWQPRVAHWNLARLAQALSPLFASAAPLQAGLDAYAATWAEAERDNASGKLGLSSCDDADLALMRELQALLHTAGADMTILFRALADIDLDSPTPAPLREAFYDDARRAAAEPALIDWLARYAARCRADELPPEARVAHMHASNPKFVLRNYLAQQAIDRATQGDDSGVLELLEVMRDPYGEQPGREAFAGRRPDWARDRAGCSMLSCSS
ncbi:YdiU family protein [Luteimonas sp. MC1572]|uniref:protein adenylyltransferase SelO n=1 Tax=Luteimonas sp. MC1572 TaxID=2799325 RepID=UPI0018F06476|nr:YdiU family protein [Luteimonas sp. MC1572]MBJ6982930.1 YdiU family protein [Luteimonas sp. MC1572]QQO04150.1 YdiU family protein [Luteimonas sp. MC1572]